MENMVETLKTTFEGQRILITGHTGFKGSWLTEWLSDYNVELFGLSDKYEDKAYYHQAKLSKKFESEVFCDVANVEEVTTYINNIKPDFIFHLAAQAIVSESYKISFKTFQTNTLGFASILEACKSLTSSCQVVMVSTDKCYHNAEWVWGYRENDRFGGDDPYSASKGAAEIVFHSYYKSFFQHDHPVKIASVRAGNVIGGGDWSTNRIVPDFYKALISGNDMLIRNPIAVRPWQHVLEPLFGYMITAQSLATNSDINGEGFNFGPDMQSCLSVDDLISGLNKLAGNKTNVIYGNKAEFKEAGILKLNTDKAKQLLKWYPVLSFNETLQKVSDWYLGSINNNPITELTKQQIGMFKKTIKDKWII
ncbi:MAG: CDP-glucose 4,6-dehydratase [Bacteroidia bacterium]|jgi:CDP-glucose 4,6-dehydratase